MLMKFDVPINFKSIIISYFMEFLHYGEQVQIYDSLFFFQ